MIQDTYTHKYEGYFGGNYLRFRPGNNLQHINEAGWHAGVTDYMFGKIGITVDGRGYYGTAYTGRNQYGVYEPSISQYTFMGGTIGPHFMKGCTGAGRRRYWQALVMAISAQARADCLRNWLALYTDGNVFNLNAGAVGRLQPEPDAGSSPHPRLPYDPVRQLDTEQSRLYGWAFVALGTTVALCIERAAHMSTALSLIGSIIFCDDSIH